MKRNVTGLITAAAVLGFGTAWAAETSGLEPRIPEIVGDAPSADVRCGSVDGGPERFEAVSRRAESFEEGRYYPPEEVAQALYDIQSLRPSLQADPCGADRLARLERAEALAAKTLSESLDKDSFVVNGNLKLFEKRFAAFEKRVAAAGRKGLGEDERRAFAAEYAGYFQGNGGELLQMYVALFKGAMTTMGEEERFGTRWLEEGVNPAAQTLARLGPRVAKLESTLGLGAPTTPAPAPVRRVPAELPSPGAIDTAGVVAPPIAPDIAPRSEVEALLAKPVLSGSMAKVRTVPPPSQPAPEGSAAGGRFSNTPWETGVLGGPGWKEEIGDRVQAHVKHLFGETKTVGDPDRRAGLMQKIEGANCGVVYQQQVLAEAGLLPPGDAGDIERALSKQAGAEGDAREHGLGWSDVGRLLVERGVPVRSYTRASDERLLAAAASGRMLIVGVEPGTFWRDPRRGRGNHAVLVTGAEVDKAGKVVGFFVNDSGTGDAGRYVPVELFLSAFAKDGRNFVEVL